jgi:zinc/manganese transport system substrate-binding protein
MIKIRSFISVSVVSALIAATFSVSAQTKEPLPVVATFSILADMVERIGGSAVEVTSLVGRNGDTHVYQPAPSDARAVKEASVLFTNGLAFEGWLDRLAEAAEFDGALVVATEGIEVIAFDEHHDDEGHNDGDKHHDDEKHHDGEGHHDAHHHGEFDPHAWQSLRNAVVYVDNIATALSKAAPKNAGQFYQNRATYLAEIEALDGQIKEMISQIPTSARTIVTSHDAFQYFGRDYGLKFVAPQGLSTESEASAREVAQLIEQIREEGVSAVFVENVADPRLIKQIANETGGVIGGKLFPGALSATDGPAATYLDLMRYNATTIATALTEAK